MRISLLLRLSLIGVYVVHIAILLSFLYPFHFPEGLFFGIWNQPDVKTNPLSTIELASFLLILPLLLPPLVVWMASTFPTRLISLIGLWISVGVLLFPCLFFYQFSWSNFLVAFHDNSSLVLNTIYLIPLIPLFGFALTLLLCLALAIALPLARAHGRSRQRLGSEAELASRREERDRRPDHPDAGAPSEKRRLHVLVPLLALLGLLTHLTIFLSLFWTYIDYYDVDMNAPVSSTGWQVLLQPFHTQPYVISNMPPPSLPLIVILLAALVIPALVFLINLLLWPVRGTLKDALLSKTMMGMYLLTLSGLVLSTFCLLISFLSGGGDSTDPVQHTYGGFATPSLMFLLSVVCSYLLLRQYQARGEQGKVRRSAAASAVER
jgi:MFS family permease